MTSLSSAAPFPQDVQASSCSHYKSGAVRAGPPRVLGPVSPAALPTTKESSCTYEELQGRADLNWPLEFPQVFPCFLEVSAFSGCSSRCLCPWDSPGQNNGVSCHSLLQGIFLTQGLNLSLLHCSSACSHQSTKVEFRIRKCCRNEGLPRCLRM